MPLEFDADAQEIELFLAENNEHLQSLDQHIVELETKPDDPQLLQQIFRSAHTIKGSAGMIGHQRMAELAHDMENVLDALRSHTVRATQRTVDALLEALDALRVLNNEVVTRTQADLPLDELRRNLAACLLQTSGATRASDRGSINSAVDWPYDEVLDAWPDNVDPDHVYFVSVNVDVSCGLSVARTFQACLELERSARVLRMIPGSKELETFERCPGLKALAELKVSPSALESALVGIVDVTSAAVERYEVPERTAPVAAVGPSEVQKRTGDRQIAAPDSTIRISVAIVDDLMSLVSELVLGRTRLQTLRSQLQENFPDDSNVANLDDAVGHLDTVVTDMQTTVMKARMLPVENVFSKFPRLVRDLTVQSGKQVSFTMSGNDTELDRSVIEQLNDPLVHLLRNALDHGVETPGERVANGKEPVGSIALSAAPMENHILIQVRDDGSGIDPAKVVSKAVEKGLITQDSASRLTEQEACELIFLPGLSTAKKITDISGRGVGMDIVKSTVDRMGGHVAVESTLGKGTTFSITLPLTLAIMQALLVTLDDAVFALPLNLVTEIQPMPDMQIQMLQGTEATVLRGMILPLLRLRQYFGCIGDDPMAGQHVVVTRVDGQILGLVVDRVIGEQEIVMKPLGRYIGYVRGLSGATILGDGRIGLLIDVAALRGWSSTQRVA